MSDLEKGHCDVSVENKDLHAPSLSIADLMLGERRNLTKSEKDAIQNQGPRLTSERPTDRKSK